MRNGFSLIELSIVLVILGLLTGGILSGQALIRAAELRAVSTEYSRYMTAIQTFRDKYFAIPGDMNNATKFWTAMASCPGDYTTPSTGAATCDGDGNGSLSVIERYRFWQHLANAGLIEGSYTGVPSTSSTANLTVGSNVPRSRVGGGGVQIFKLSDTTPSTNLYNPTDSRHTFIFLGAATLMVGTPAALLTPEEAWNVDTKMDDGTPGTGIFYNYTTGSSTVGTCTTSASAYALTLTSKVCAPYIMATF